MRGGANPEMEGRGDIYIIRQACVYDVMCKKWKRKIDVVEKNG